MIKLSLKNLIILLVIKNMEIKLTYAVFTVVFTSEIITSQSLLGMQSLFIVTFTEIYSHFSLSVSPKKTGFHIVICEGL